jgi:hypothetical protein
MNLDKSFQTLPLFHGSSPIQQHFEESIEIKIIKITVSENSNVKPGVVSELEPAQIIAKCSQ